ncbi:MAG: biotin transporter BioY [Alphaproteobacteria bacterium]|nr:biotin transporter BioY [Alphaproteobacteria bacterium]
MYLSAKIKNNVLLRAFVGGIFIAIMSQISVPVQPVPFTLQTLAVLLLAIVLGAHESVYAVCLYLTAGVCGLPVFANFSGGVTALVGPTGGYLIGFVPLAYIVGKLAERFGTNNVFTTFIIGVCGIAVLMLCGYLQLACFVGFEKAYLFGVAPFFGVECLKLSIFSLLSLVTSRK